MPRRAVPAGIRMRMRRRLIEAVRRAAGLRELSQTASPTRSHAIEFGTRQATPMYGLRASASLLPDD
jgi:hypothetical protein